MRIMIVCGAVLIAVAVVALVVGVTGAGEPWPNFVLAGVAGVFGVVLVQVPRGIMRFHDELARKARDLETRGVRRVGVVRDVVPFSSPSGGAVLGPGGAQMVVQIALPRDGGGTQTVTCHLIENSEQARARIGQQIAVIEHPDDPEMRAIEGYQPNGRRRSSNVVI
jgi:hypothetical protein